MRALRYIIQHAVDFLCILAYPLWETKNYHQRLIDRPTRPTGKCSEQRVSLVLFVYLMTLFTVAYAHDPQPVVNLENGFSNYNIHFGQKTFQLVYDDNGIVMTNSDLIRRHQLMSISRVIDNTDIALANSLVRSSLSSYDQVNTHDNFTWISDKIYHLSPTNMTFLDCKLYCASRSSVMINTVTDVWRVDHNEHFSFSSVWMDTTTQASPSYKVFLESTMLYPNNKFTAGNPPPSVFYQDALQLTKIDSISTFYTNYYSSQKKEYWPTSFYDLRVSLHKSGAINLYIPVQAGELEVAQSRCACSKIPTQATRDIRRISRDLRKLRIQALNISIEANRVRKNNQSTGNVLEIISNKLTPQPFIKANIEEIMPLNFSLTNDKLITPSTVAIFTAKAVGVPMLQKAFESYFHKFKETLPAAKLVPFKNNTSFILPKSVRLTGIQNIVSNFSMILAFDGLPHFEKDLSKMSDLDIMHELLSNLTLTNEQFISFLHTKVYDYVTSFAAKGLSQEIDTSFPVLVHLKPALSFLKFDCFFATFEPTSAMTAYNILAFPHALVDQQFKKIETPEYVTISPNTFSFAFEGKHSKVLSDCLDNVISGSITTACEVTNFNKNAITKNNQIPDISIFTLISTEQAPANVKISCPGMEQFSTMTPYMVTVLATSPSCNIGFTTQLGTVNMLGNQTYNLSPFPPRILFAYNLESENSQTQTNTILIVCIIAVIILSLLIIVAGIIFLIRNSQKVDVVVSENSSIDSQLTVKNYIINPMPPCPHSATIARRNVHFPDV